MSFNKASSELNLISIRGGESWRLGEQVIWTDSYGNKITVPAGFTFDLASIPWFARWFVSNDDYRVRRPAALHDYLYAWRGCTAGRILTRYQCDKLFFNALVSEGMSIYKSFLMFLAVRVGGWYAWQSLN